MILFIAIKLPASSNQSIASTSPWPMNHGVSHLSFLIIMGTCGQHVGTIETNKKYFADASTDYLLHCVLHCVVASLYLHLWSIVYCDICCWKFTQSAIFWLALSGQNQYGGWNQNQIESTYLPTFLRATHWGKHECSNFDKNYSNIFFGMYTLVSVEFDLASTM